MSDARSARVVLRERAVEVLAMLLAAVPVLVTGAPPMGDLPLHEAEIALVRHLGDPAFAPASVYAWNLGHGGQLFHLAGAVLSLVVSPVLAARLLVAASLAGVVAATARLARHLGTASWSCLLALPLLGWTFQSGFAPNLLGIALFLALLPQIDRAADVPSARGAAGVLLAMVGCHLVHDAALIAVAVAVLVLGLARPRPLDRQAPLRFAPLLGAVALLAFETHLESRDMTAFAARWSKVEWHALGDKVTHVGDFAFGLSSGAAGAVLRVSFLAVLAVLAVLVAAVALGISRQPVTLHGARFLLLAAALLLLYFALPYSVNYGAYLYVRFLAPAALVAVVALAPPASAPVRSRRLLGLLAAVPLVAFVFASAPAFRRADASQRDLDRLLARIVDATPAGEVPRVCSPQLFRARPGDDVLLSQPLRILALRGGRVLHSLADYPNAPVVVRRGARWDEALLRLTFTPNDLAPDVDFTRFEWLLVYAPGRQDRDLLAAALAPEASVVDHAGRWVLFHSTLPLVPLDAPDAPPPPGASTLQARVAALQTAR